MTAGGDTEVWTLPPGLHHGDEHGVGGAEAEGRGPHLCHLEEREWRDRVNILDGQGSGHQGEQVHGQVTHHRLDENDRDGTGTFDPRRHQEPRRPWASWRARSGFLWRQWTWFFPDGTIRLFVEAMDMGFLEGMIRLGMEAVDVGLPEAMGMDMILLGTRAFVEATDAGLLEP